MRLAAKTDRNHGEIVQALRQVGAAVLDLSRVGRGCPDLLVQFRGRLHLLEAKSPKGDLTPAQVELAYRFEFAIVHSVEQALQAIGARRRTSKPAESLADERILDPEELLERIPLDRSTVYRMVQEKRFPPPIQLTSTRIGWRWSAILQWLAEREAGHIKTGPLSGRDKPA